MVFPRKDDAGRIFAGSCAIVSRLFVGIATGFALAPMLHRVLHSFHVGEDRSGND
ncbi:hypothetical protein BIWAKO_03658 [Bosea sp. BIWAKO-01]|nr:hypothetical protein BIWAKO_03658 [Bosea sp. BIWAKO-01]